jgi:oligopeptide transport system ATP-binding protein
VVRALSDRILVMKDGRVVETGSTDEILERPREAYTQELVAAAALAEQRPATSG